MERKKFTQEFAGRLIALMREKGYSSDRSVAGIDIHKLADISGSSYQMARKYALGLALPEVLTIIKIAEFLDSSPNELLLDASSDCSQTSKRKSGNTFLEIELNLLRYILQKSIPVFFMSKEPQNIVNFIVDTAYDASHLNVDPETVREIVDMMISSVIRLNKTNQDGKNNVA